MQWLAIVTLLGDMLDQCSKVAKKKVGRIWTSVPRLGWSRFRNIRGFDMTCMYSDGDACTQWYSLGRLIFTALYESLLFKPRYMYHVDNWMVLACILITTDTEYSLQMAIRGCIYMRIYVYMYIMIIPKNRGRHK